MVIEKNADIFKWVCDNCGKISQIPVKKIKENTDYRYCCYCRTYHKNCSVCGTEHFKQGLTCSPQCAKVLKEDSWLKSTGAKHNFCRNSSSRIEQEKKFFSDTGCVNVFQLDSVKEKIKETIIEKYNTDNVSKLDYIKIQKKETFRRNYGVNSIWDIESFRDSNKSFRKWFDEFMLSKYGKVRISNGDKISNTKNSQEFRKKMEDKGYWLKIELLSSKDKYYFQVSQFTHKSLREYGELKFGKNWKEYKKLNNLHIDHKFSKAEGLSQGIHPKIIGSIVNLDLIDSFSNLSKGKKCSISKEKLINDFDNFKML